MDILKNFNGYTVGVDFAKIESELSVMSVFQKQSDGSIKLISCEVLGNKMTPDEKTQVMINIDSEYGQ